MRSDAHTSLARVQRECVRCLSARITVPLTVDGERDGAGERERGRDRECACARKQENTHARVREIPDKTTKLDTQQFPY